MSQITTVAIAGLGGRGRYAYAKQAKLMPDKMKIVAIADLNPEKVAVIANEYSIPEDMCFSSAEEMLEKEKLAEIMFICTQDKDHYSHAVSAMKKGYHLLLEKPISPDFKECSDIVRAANEYKRNVTVCHGLRYTAFYQTIKKLVDSKVIGDIVNINAVENVGYWHQAHSYVRGNWRNSHDTSPMILAKSCHDIDILLWLSGKNCKSISSYGSTYLFKKEKAPKGAAVRCMDGCECKESCPYDAEKIYIENKITGIKRAISTWPCSAITIEPTPESVTKAIKEGPYGRCVYYCDNNVVDHQVLNMEMEDSSTIAFTMSGFTEKNMRTIRIMGTMGEIEGNFDTNIINVTQFGRETEQINVKIVTNDLAAHGGGDAQMLRELFDSAAGVSTQGSSLTSIEKSVQSHYIAFAAEQSRLNSGKSIDIDQFIIENIT